MSGIDIAIVVVVLLSALISYFRGFFKEAMSLTVWVGAILITVGFSSRFASLIPADAITTPSARLAASAVVLFLGTLLVGAVANFLVRRIVASARLKLADRIIGVVFGLARGVVIVAVLVLVAHLSPELRTERWWVESELLPEFQTMARAIHRQLPQELAQHFDFSEAA